MKKILTTSVAALLSATMLCGCNKSSGTTRSVPIPYPFQDGTVQTEDVQKPDKPIMPRNDGQDAKIEIDGDNDNDIGFFWHFGKRSAMSGVRRCFERDRSGTYTIEYVHAPYDKDKDDTLDYRLTLNNDNTFEFTVVTDGVTAEHNGHWYERRGNIMMFYDEEIPDKQHNVYVSDTMYADLLPQGKIMIYDNCYTIVLSKQNTQAIQK